MCVPARISIAKYFTPHHGVNKPLITVHIILMQRSHIFSFENTLKFYCKSDIIMKNKCNFLQIKRLLCNATDH